MDGYFERGEVYWVRLDAGVGAEKGYGRPGVIVSANFLNSSSDLVSVAFTTTKPCDHIEWDVRIDATDRTSWVQCNQVMSYDKSRLGSCLGKLNAAEMRAVDDALEMVFDLGYEDSAVIKGKDSEIAALNIQIDELHREKTALELKIAKREDDTVSMKVEIEMWKRLYEKALDQVCGMKLTGDIAMRTEQPPKPQPVKQPPVESTELLDINTASFYDLKKAGLSNNVIVNLINKRPYKSVEDLKNVPGLNACMYGIVSKKVCCVPVKESEPAPVSGKVNINTASAKELNEIAGITISTCYEITGYRKRNCPYKSVDDLLDVKRCGPIFLNRHRDKLEV